MADRLLSLEAAREAVLAGVAALAEIEALGPVDALGRVLAADIVAMADLPPWDNSAMDGYAVLAADVAAATENAPIRLLVDGEVAAGQVPDVAPRHGRAIRIATGAPVPPGGTAVVPVEDTTPIDARGTPCPRGRDATGPLPAEILVHVPAAHWANIRARASDIAAGTTVLRAGAGIGPAEVSLAAAATAATIPVRRRPRVAVLSTGDELRAAGSELGAAGIPDSNGPALVALARAAGAETRSLGIAPDRFGPLVTKLRRGIAWADVVIVSGGVSVGPYDVVKRAFEAVGRIDLWRVAVQPGKPFAFGLAERPVESPTGAAGTRGVGSRGAGTQAAGTRGAGRPVLLFGLPGNPVSTFVTFELFVRPALRRLAGRPDDALLRPVDAAVLEERVSTSVGRRTFVRVVARRDARGTPVRDEQGRVCVRLAGGQESHVISALAAADGLAIVPESVGEQQAGAPVELWWLDRP